MREDDSSQTIGSWRQTAIPAIGLFASLGTLICCALPALFVTLGMGMAVAGLVSAAPWLITLSEHKVIVFGIAGGTLAVATVLQWRGRRAACPADPQKAMVCAKLRKVSWNILGVAIAVYVVGFFFAFLAADIFYGK